MYTTLKLIGMRIQMWDQTQLRRLSNHNFLSQTRKMISLKRKIHKTITTILRTITTINSGTGLILLITKDCPNNSNQDLILNSTDSNISNKRRTKGLLLRMNFNRISFNSSRIISITIPTMSSTSRRLSLVPHNWMCLNLPLLLILWPISIHLSKNSNSSFQPSKKTSLECNINKNLWWRTIIKKLRCYRSRSSRS